MLLKRLWSLSIPQLGRDIRRFNDCHHLLPVDLPRYTSSGSVKLNNPRYMYFFMVIAKPNPD